MTYRVVRDDTGQPEITLTDEPAYCRALRTVPQVELNTGRWLVLAFAVWSVPDVAAVRVALDAVRQFGGAVRLALHPFEDADDLPAVQPALGGDDGRSPIWRLLDDGTVTLGRTGSLTVAELTEALSCI